MTSPASASVVYRYSDKTNTLGSEKTALRSRWEIIYKTALLFIFLHFSSKLAFPAKFLGQFLHFASKLTFSAKMTDTNHKGNGDSHLLIARRHTRPFRKRNRLRLLFRIELFSVNRPCKLHILYHTFDIIWAYRISLRNLCFSIFIVLNNFFNW